MKDLNLKTEYEIDGIMYVVINNVSANAKKHPKDIIKSMYLDELRSNKFIVSLDDSLTMRNNNVSLKDCQKGGK